MTRNSGLEALMGGGGGSGNNNRNALSLIQLLILPFRNRVFKSISILLFLCLILAFITRHSNIVSNSALLFEEIDLYKKKSDMINISQHNCSPVKLNFQPYSANINGVAYPQYLPVHFNDSIDFHCLNNNPRTKLILFWNKFYGDESFYYSLGRKTPFEANHCPVTNCELTTNRLRVNEADLVVVSVLDQTAKFPDGPRPQNQKWVFTVIESPIHTPEFSHYNGVFNLTATYLSDSDFTNSYEHQGSYMWKENVTFDINYDFYKDKVDFATALISNCGAGTRRLEYIAEMQKLVSVKVFGKCGQPCPTHFKNNESGDCKRIIGTEFKFYLAFENSVCKDYITEKFFYMLNHNIIPVVLGGGNYSQFVSI
jgi:hypothetical protein